MSTFDNNQNNTQFPSYDGNNSMNTNATLVSSRHKLAAGLMAIFVGGLGIHNFYLGFKGKAIAQLLISVLSIGLLACISIIWSFVEGICILCSQPGTKWHKDADGAELQD
ncbi:TM2 domain-containing protein [Gardnerella sp. DNF01192]|uniref:TM2 domain-containing protein n=1 Tax=Gardnerella sp. DNF01192 TaxID=2749064 RepID=UPI003BAB9A41